MKYFILLLLIIVAAVSARSQHPFAQMFKRNSQLADTDCKDIGTNCQNWARNGFCKNCNWTCAQRRHYCERTCGFCHPDYVCNETCPTFTPRKSEFLTKEEIRQLDK